MILQTHIAILGVHITKGHPDAAKELVKFFSSSLISSEQDRIQVKKWQKIVDESASKLKEKTNDLSGSAEQANNTANTTGLEKQAVAAQPNKSFHNPLKVWNNYISPPTSTVTIDKMDDDDL